jgi:glycosyltransferase involved in cell wall biosynthesis
VTVLVQVAIIQNIPITDHRMVHTDGISRQLIDQGYHVTAIIQKSDKKNQFKAPPYEIVQLEGDTYSIKGQLIFTYKLLNYLRKHQFDIIHAKNPFSSILAPLIIRKSGSDFKLVYDIRGLWADFLEDTRRRKSSWVFLFNKIDVACMNMSDGVIAISDELARILAERGVHRDKIKVIVGDGVNTEKIRGLKPIETKELFGIKGPTLGYIGSIGVGRSSNRIIEAFKHVKDKIPEAGLIMVGPIYGEDTIRRIIQELRLGDSVFLTGFIDSHETVLRYCKSFDVALSYHEINKPSFNVMVPTKLLEYFACGRPIVATDHSAHASVLEHGSNAYLTPQNPLEFAEGIIKVIEDEQLRHTLTKNSLQSAENYSFRTISKQVAEFYRGL